MRKSKLGKNNNEHEKQELNNDLSDIEKGITEDGQILPEESYKLLRRVRISTLHNETEKKLVY